MADSRLRLVEEGTHCSVWITSEAEKALAEYERRHVYKVASYMRLFAQSGQRAVNNNQKFKHEGTFSVENLKIKVCAFKSYQLRVYGGFTPDKSNRFVCVLVEKKKKERANKSVLERAAMEIAQCANR